MDGRDSWHVASCQAGSQHKTIVNPIMLRFRPIAPKPVSGGAFPGGISPENPAVLRTTKRVKRKYVRVRKDNNNNDDDDHSGRRRNINRSSAEKRETTTVTLQLMPEKSDGQDLTQGRSWCIIDRTVSNEDDNNLYRDNKRTPVEDYFKEAGEASAVTAAAPAVAVVESWVTVECVTDTCMDVRGLGCTDVERIKNLERDTCPGFVSDGFCKVQWVNAAYKRMVVGPEEEEEEGGDRRRQWLPEMVVWLVDRNNDKGKLGCTEAAFTCRVRVQYMKNMNNNKEKCSKIMPCDVWRMDSGGFAWRLDVKAALGLGL